MPAENAFEDRLRSLAARGFDISVSLNKEEYGEDRGKTMFGVMLRKGRYGSAELEARGQGVSLDAAAHAALVAAEAYLAASDAAKAVRGALSDLGTTALPAA